MENETMRCPYCIDGWWYKDPNFREPYGYPYTPPKIPCGVCQGTKAILKENENCRPDLQKISEEERVIFWQKQQDKKKK